MRMNALCCRRIAAVRRAVEPPLLPIIVEDLLLDNDRRGDAARGRPPELNRIVTGGQLNSGHCHTIEVASSGVALRAVRNGADGAGRGRRRIVGVAALRRAAADAGGDNVCGELILSSEAESGGLGRREEEAAGEGAALSLGSGRDHFHDTAGEIKRGREGAEGIV